LRGVSLRKIAGSPLRGSATGVSSDFSATATPCAADLRFTSGGGSCAFAIAAAREASPEPRRSSMRRSIRVPHMPQNFIPGSFKWPQPAHVVLPDLRVLRSACRLSMRTPQVPQNLCSGRFSVPQKVQSMRAFLTPLSAVTHTSPKNSSSVISRMISGADKLQAHFCLRTPERKRALVLSELANLLNFFKTGFRRSAVLRDN
jgi:hypothetical protein